MQQLLPFFQIGVSIFLVTTILLQRQSSGLGSAFGGGDGIYHTKRGAEKYLFLASIVFAGLFLILAVLGIFL